MLRSFPGRAFALAWALGLAVAWLPAGAQIHTSKHNLTSRGSGLNRFGAAEEICVFCHTPMGFDAIAAVPQWNRSLPSPAMYQTYDTLGTSTLAGKVAPVGSVSMACLSCHDGSQAMSAVINASRSGWTDGTWGGGPQAGAVLLTTSSSSVGNDLRDDHPIGVQYGGGGITGARPTAPTHNPDFRSADSAVLNETRVWWIGTGVGANGTRRKSDLTLYTRTSTDGYPGQGDAEPFVECASCHDPHSGNALFLRISNTGSALCLACHMK